MTDRPAVLITGAGRRYDIVSAFAEQTTTIACDLNPLAPAQYAAQLRAEVPPNDDPAFVAALERVCEEHGVGAIIPLIDPDIEILATAREERGLPAFVSDLDVARASFDKLATHELLRGHDLPSPPTVAPGGEIDFPVVVKPRAGSLSRSVHVARDRAEAEFFTAYVGEPVVWQRMLGGEHVSLDCLGDLDGRCLNAIPRTMLESRGGEAVKGRIPDDPELVEVARATMDALRVRGPGMIQLFRDPDLGIGIHDVNLRFGGGFAGPMYAALPGFGYPELIVRMAAGERIEPHVGRYRKGGYFARFNWQIELDEHMRPTGRDIVGEGFRQPGSA
ncbi:MAG: ATP-grasp domain-containing protein [Solirubrobacteraceae bacterium]